MCGAPFKGPGAPLMRIIGKRPSTANPNWCTWCFDYMTKHRGGAEVEGAFLFADIRGSTSLAERLRLRVPRPAGAILRDRDERRLHSTRIVDKFVGDELVALFYPLLTGERYAERAIDAAKELCARPGHGDPGGPWVPVGVGVHSGRAWFGSVGEGTHVEMTAVGDAVNIAARLAAAAEAGEILVSADAAGGPASTRPSSAMRSS